MLNVFGPKVRAEWREYGKELRECGVLSSSYISACKRIGHSDQVSTPGGLSEARGESAGCGQALSRKKVGR